MKLAWICYPYEDDPTHVTIVFSEPQRYGYFKVVPIVYAEVIAL